VATIITCEHNNTLQQRADTREKREERREKREERKGSRTREHLHNKENGATAQRVVLVSGGLVARATEFLALHGDQVEAGVGGVLSYAAHDGGRVGATLEGDGGLTRRAVLALGAFLVQDGGSVAIVITTDCPLLSVQLAARLGVTGGWLLADSRGGAALKTFVLGADVPAVLVTRRIGSGPRFSIAKEGTK
jgi:hypothetical protein